ncbi:chaperone NapD [Azospirillum rugosum]|uniref:Chaperone NapD n=1 Tax=Azospirillum rugosum TaxID=416170 RepID=A0ABS4SKW7_9PROT|nr:chaperone NapD [Azospirillum rugosum]MBP2292060.1 nitrate reductase NapD [Azospirillum rugosum]MDQ0525804.1 nitrate reductase NapD [Azospirillum rugosum]
MRPESMPAEWHIASILVHLRPERSDAIRAAVSAMPGTEIHIEEAGKMIVTVEAPNEGRIADHMTAMHLLDGVMSAVLVFHHVEPAGVAAEEANGSTDV